MYRWIFQTANRGLEALAGNPLWHLFRMYELTEIMRQQNRTFADALNRLAVGQLTPEDVALFRRQERGPGFQAPEGAIHLFSTNAAVDAFNDRIITALQPAAPDCIAADRFIGGRVNQRTRDAVLAAVHGYPIKDTAGLPTRLKLRLNIRYMITNNINTEDGLVNGATGHLRQVSIANGLATILWLQFDDPVIGQITRRQQSQPVLNEDPTGELIPILKVVKPVKQGRNGAYEVVREQFPVVPAEAITIHKSQGATFQTVVVHLADRIARPMLYVACSRATTIERLFFVDQQFRPPRPREATDTIAVEMQRLRNPVDDQGQPLPPLLTLPTWPADPCHKVIFHNIEGLERHFMCTFADQTFSEADVVLFAETREMDRSDLRPAGFFVVAQVLSQTGTLGTGSLAAVRMEQAMHARNLLEHSWHGNGCRIEITLITLNRLAVMGVYSSPRVPVNQLEIELEMAIQRVPATCSSLLIMGDFNINTMEPPEGRFNLVDFMNRHNPQLHFLLRPDQVTTNGNTQIDLIFASNEQALGFVYESPTSYHKPIMATVPLDDIQ